MFGNLASAEGLNKLNAYLAERSYIDGYQPSQADVVVFEAVANAPVAHANCLRWYCHIKSFAGEFAKLPGDKSGAAAKYGGSASAPQEKASAKDDDFELFGSDDEEESEEAKRIKEERLKAYAEKKSKKEVIIAKSSVILDVKPWESETSMSDMEKSVRSIIMDGLVWGGSKLVPLAYGIHKLQITCVVEDDKVSIDELTEKICEDFEELVQSVDIAAFNKI